PQLDFNANSVAPKELLQTLTLNCSVSSSNTSQSSHVHFMYILHETTGVLASIYKTQYNAVTQDKGLTSAHGTLSSQETEESYLQLTWASPNVSQSGKYFCGAHGVTRSGAEETITINVEKITWEDLVHSFLNLHKDVNEVRQIHTSHKPEVIVLKEYIEDSMTTIHKKINEVKESQETTKQDITRIKEDLNITIASIHRQINEGEERQGIIQQDIMRSNAILNRTLTSIQTNLDE
uniref:Protein kinase domain-containing protein n=1 Tax=Biomphalaria glabrata TaxID=6526 RepID=A0A2C9LSY8_BIOGL